MSIFRILLLFVLTTILSSCTTLGEKADRYEEVSQRFLLPDHIQIKYERTGNDVSGYEMRCFGDGCDGL